MTIMIIPKIGDNSRNHITNRIPDLYNFESEFAELSDKNIEVRPISVPIPISKIPSTISVC